MPVPQQVLLQAEVKNIPRSFLRNTDRARLEALSADRRLTAAERAAVLQVLANADRPLVLRSGRVLSHWNSQLSERDWQALRLLVGRAPRSSSDRR
jgi:anaerobic selenocysteine-containing dehydrogenase